MGLPEMLANAPRILGGLLPNAPEVFANDAWSAIPGSMGVVRDVGESFDEDRGTTYQQFLLTVVYPLSGQELTRGDHVRFDGDTYAVERIRSLAATRQVECIRKVVVRRGPDRGRSDE
jgi:hypothetical protein